MMSSGLSPSSQFPTSSFEILWAFFHKHLPCPQTEEVPALPPFLSLINVGAAARGVEVAGTGFRVMVSVGEGSV